MNGDRERNQIRQELHVMNDDDLKGYLQPDNIEETKRLFYIREAFDELVRRGYKIRNDGEGPYVVLVEQS